MRLRQTLKASMGNGLLVLFVTTTLIGPLLAGNISLAFISFVPWFVALMTLGQRRHAVLKVTIFSCSVGGLRAIGVCGPMLAMSDRPLSAIGIGFAYSGVIHMAAGLVAFYSLRRRRLWGLVIAALTVPAMDLIWCGPISFTVPYLTAVYIAAGSDLLLRLVPFVGPYGISILIGVVSLALALAWSHKGTARCFAGIALAATSIWDMVPAPVVASGPTLSVAALTHAEGWSANISRLPVPPDLVVIPESAVIAPPADPAEPGDVSLNDLRRDQNKLQYAPALLAGVLASNGDVEGTYRNRILFRTANGHEAWNDKRIPVPGIEVVPFADWPLIGPIYAYASPVSGRLILAEKTANVPITVRSFRVATAICYDHCVPDPCRAWGIDRSTRPDLLICIARERGLGPAKTWERYISERARRLHAAFFNCELLYVTDSGSEIVAPNRRSVRSDHPDITLWNVAKRPARAGGA